MQVVADFQTKPRNGAGTIKLIQAAQLIWAECEAMCWKTVLGTISVLSDSMCKNSTEKKLSEFCA